MSDNPASKIDPVIKMDAAVLRQTAKPANEAKKEAVAVGTAHQLFADDHLVAQMSGLRRRLNRPHKEREPFMTHDRPWEGQGLVYGCVIPHEGAYRFYYKGFETLTKLNYADFSKQHGYGKYNICLAQSDDAVNFEKKPLAGAVKAGTNIVVDDQIDDFTVLRDDNESAPQHRFKLLASRGNWWAGLTPATSPDGIAWTWGQDHAVTYLGDRCSYWYDPIQRKHVAWSRNYKLMGGRVIVHKETTDFANWADPRESHPILAIQPDRYDHEQTQFYGGYAFWYHSLYFAYLEVYYLHHQRLDTQLCCSRDGRNWTRLCDRDVFLPAGEHGEFDAYWAVPTFNPPIMRDGRLLIHYNGRVEPHSQPGFPCVPPGGMGGAFALSTLREDGFVSLDAGGAVGVLETVTLAAPAKWSALEVNCTPFSKRPEAPPMDVKVEVLDENGASLAAFAVNPQAPAQTWYKFMPGVIMPATLRLRFHLANARLYSFRFCQ